MTEWVRVSETLINEIERGIVEADERLPSDAELASRFGVHRHTVRRALVDLQSRGLVRTERGRGTFVVKDAIAYRLGAQARFEENLAANNMTATRRLLSSVQFGAPDDIADHLGIEAGKPVLMITLLGEADGVPAHIFAMWFPLDRMPNVRSFFEALPKDEPFKLSVEDVMRNDGISSFHRKSVRLGCRLPRPDEARILRVALQDPVFEAEIPNYDDDGKMVYFGVTVFPGIRTTLVFDC